MRTYPSIRYPNEPETDGLLEPGADIVVMEKLDGANFRWHFDEDGRIVPGSRRVEYESADDENLDKNFIHTIEYLEHVLDIEDVGDLVEVKNGDGSTTDWEVALRVDICANCAVPIDARTYCHHWDP